MRTICFSGEDPLSEALARRCVSHVLPGFEFANMRPRQGGRSGVEKQFQSYLKTAQHIPFFVMLDLDDAMCPPSARQNLLSQANAPNLPDRFILSVVRRESEAWLLGDRAEISRFLGIPVGRFPNTPEDIRDPKAALVSLASRSHGFKKGLCPDVGTGAKVGPDYNEVLGQFVSRHWRPEIAAKICPTLDRTLERLEILKE